MSFHLVFETWYGSELSLEATRYDLGIGEIQQHGSQTPIDLSCFRHLQCLTIRATTCFEKDIHNRDICATLLPAAIETAKTASSLQHLNIEIRVIQFTDAGNVDLSPLTDLAASSSFHHIDIFILSVLKAHAMTILLSTILSLVADNEGLMKLIDQGMLVIHPEEMAPTFLDTVHSRSTLVRHPTFP